MKQSKNIMGMPITVEVVGVEDENILDSIFSYFVTVDETFSTYKDTSEISQINRGELNSEDASGNVKEILKLAEQTKKETNGYFDIVRNDKTIDPSGIVKGWAIHEAAKILVSKGLDHFYIDAGGDVQVSKPLSSPDSWKVGIQNPFNSSEIIKVVNLRNDGMATSGIYNRGAHIYNPLDREKGIEDIVSLSVIGPNVYEADRFATAAFAMGKGGIYFLENQSGLEGYQIDKNGVATMTTGFNKFTDN